MFGILDDLMLVFCPAIVVLLILSPLHGLAGSSSGGRWEEKNCNKWMLTGFEIWSLPAI